MLGIHAIGADPDLQGIALKGVGSFEVNGLSCERTTAHQLADVWSEGPDGPAVDLTWVG